MKNLRRVVAAWITLLLMGALAPLVITGTADANATDVVISEFLAINDQTLADNTGDYVDWIELHNTSDFAVDLAGWTIADSSDSFVFPADTQIQGGEYLVLFASGDASRTTPSEIHLPFKLSGGGESLTLRDSVGTLSEPSWAAPVEYPSQLADDSYGVASGGEVRYFTNPTPGAPNGGGVGGLVDPVEYSVEHGYYDATQNVVLTTATPDATIRYTTNGQAPTPTTGTAVSPGTAITVSSTTTIRAMAYRDGWINSPVESRSYLFTSDIINQGRPADWPVGPVNGQALDYGMDPNVVTGNEAAIQASLTGIPTISIVTDADNLFGATNGIYVNADKRGREWERQAAVELIDPSGAQAGFDIEAGLRIRGGYSRHDNNAKHAFRLYFRDDYEGQLDYPLFGDEGEDRFEIIDLRSASNYAWSWRHTREATFIEELWSRDTQAAMGQPYTRSRLYHLFLNGTYWGMFMSQERVSGEYGETYFGGGEDDYDVVKRNAPGSDTEATDGDTAAWSSLFALVSDLQVDAVEYQTIDSQVDLVNLADYYLLHVWSGDFDGSPSWYLRSQGSWRFSNNWFALRNRAGVGPAGKWTFFDHDSEHSLCASSGPGLGKDIDNTTPFNLGPGAPNLMTPAWLHEALLSNDAYRQIFIDRVQMHMLTPGGALTLPEVSARFEARAAQVSPAVEAESARWGDGGGEPAYGRSDWEYGLQLKRDCFVDRLPIIEQQLRDDGLWPLSNPPAFSPSAGAVPYGTNATVDAGGQAGTLYITTDGSDPRAVDGSVSASAQPYNGPVVVGGDLTLGARVLNNGQWTPLATASYTLSTPAGPVTLALNEFNAVSASNFLGGNGQDQTFGRVAGNGGDWFELIVTQDGLDVRGWTVEVWNDVDGVQTQTSTLIFGTDEVLSDLHAGSLITVSEDIADDVSYSPVHGDWHINLQSNNAQQGAYLANQTNFSINNNDTQIAIKDAAGLPVQLRTGEGTVPAITVGNDEVFKLTTVPTTAMTPADAGYVDGNISTWGLPNMGDVDGSQPLDSQMRLRFGDADCDTTVSLGDALVIAQYSVSARTDSGGCPLGNPATQVNAAAGDVDDNGSVDLGDALLVAQCTVGVTNDFCLD